MASTSLADPNLPTAVAADQAGISGNQAQSRDPHAREGLTCDGQLDWSKLKISDPWVGPPYILLLARIRMALNRIRVNSF